MGYAFPNAPTIGDTANGYTWNGQAWAGGQAVSGAQIEQFFDLAGKTSQDISVPSWAKGAVIQASIVGSVGSSVRVSFDGTTFLAGASDYAVVGATHQSGAGASAYSTNTQIATNAMFFSAGGDDSVVPHSISAELNLVRISTTVCHLKTYSKSLMVAAGAAARTFWGQNWATIAASGANLVVKALRIFPNSGSFGASSWLGIKWLGDVPVPVGGGGGENLAANTCIITCNASQSLNSAAFNKIDAALNSITHDPAGMWDNTLKRIIPKKAGIYMFEGMATLENLTDATRMVVGIYKNGALEALLGRGTAGATGISGFGGSVLLKANGTTDYYELWAYHNSGSAQTIQGTIAGGYNGYTHFGATYIGSA